ncbi:nitroreductase family protein [Candidatus Foliamicus sp.]
MSSAEPPGLKLVRERRTVALFKREKPSRELLLAAVEAARWAPNHHLTEPWRFFLLGPDTAKAMTGIAEQLTLEKRGTEAAKRRRELMEATPAWMAVTCRRSEDAFREREDYGASCCAIQNLMLCLWESGLACKWSTGALTRDSRFLDLLDVDAREQMVVGLFSIGYPRIVPRQKRLPVEEILVTLD